MKLLFATGNKGKLREAQEILGDRYELVSPKSIGVFEEPVEDGDSFAANSMIKASYLWEIVQQREDLQDIDGVFADDSGLVVDILDGAPGIYSARYATMGDDAPTMVDCDIDTKGVQTDTNVGKVDHDFDANIEKLLREISKKDPQSQFEHSARFVCVVTLILRECFACSNVDNNTIDGGGCIAYNDDYHVDVRRKDESQIVSFDGTIEGRISQTIAGDGGFGYDPVFVPDPALVDEKYKGKTLAEIPEEVKNKISHRYNALCQMSHYLD